MGLLDPNASPPLNPNSSTDPAPITDPTDQDLPPSDDPPRADDPPADDPPADDPPADDPPADDPPPPDPLAVVPETAEGYALADNDFIKTYIPNAAEDAAILALREHFHETGATQGEFNRVFDSLQTMVDKGIIPPPLNPEAEVAALSEGGVDGAARMAEQETWLRSLQTRGDINDEDFGELMSLVPTARGTRALENLRKTMTTTNVQPPGDKTTADPAAEAQANAQAMHSDPRYKTDRQFKKAADTAWREAFGE